jgi:AcrR family transcriptional regulator
MDGLSLRERKFAATKAAIQAAVLKRLNQQTLDDIVVKDVCQEVQISETTFFNYFASKQEVIAYTVQIWSIVVAWEMLQTVLQSGKHLLAIRRLFDLTAEMTVETAGLMGEILAYQAKMQEPFVFHPLTRAEYAQQFPNIAGIEAIAFQSIDQLLFTHLESALETGELIPGTDLRSLTMTLIAIFFVTPILVRQGFDGEVKEAYRQQLDLLLPD